MELKIVNPESNDFCEAVGISPERQKELSKALDAMVRRLDSGPIQLHKMHNLFAEILSFCRNEAESVYCTVLHCGLQARRGRILAPGPVNKAALGLAIEMLYDRLRRDYTTENQKIMEKLRAGIDDPLTKEGAREGVQRLIDLKEIALAKNIMNRLTGFAF